MSKTPQAAFIAMMNEFDNVHADRVNPAFKSRYCSLGEILSTAKPIAAKHGFAIVQRSLQAETQWVLHSFFYHESGTEMTGNFLPLRFDPSKTDQAAASSLTYARRNGLQLLCGTSIDLDDDGNAASNNSVLPPTPTVPFSPSKPSPFPPKPAK